MFRNACLALAITTAASAPALATEPVSAEVYVSGFTTPLEFVQNPTNPAIQYVVQQNGLIRVINNGALQATPFLNVQSRISSGSERGLLGMALDPDFASNRRFYINYTNTAGNTHVASYTANNNLTADFNSENVILVVNQDFSNHNGGNIRTGPDGYLYIAMGDGGSGGDPFNRAQDRTQLLGKILRIDPTSDDFPADPNRDYAIPADNPYAGHASFRPEIWAYGMRNTWKFTFDQGACGTDGIFLADVGQNAREEINYEPANSGGGRNYGWDCREGTASFSGCTPPSGESFTEPIYDYLQSSFGRSITGGYIYRGTEMAHNRGRYYFADFISGRSGSLQIDFDGSGNATASDFIEHTAEFGGLGNISAFGLDADNELYILSFNGTIYRVRGTYALGDANQDDNVGSGDLATLLAAWGSTDCGVTDLNNDEMVNSADLAILLAAWGDVAR